jgi:integrase
MGSIIGRRRKDGTMAYLAKIAIMREGVVVLREARTFDRKPAAKTWLDTREKALAVPGAIDRAKADRNDPPLADVIERYTTEFKKKLGRTNAQVLRSIKAHDFGRKKCSAIDTPALCDFAKSLECGPSTRGNYMSHLASVFGVARLMWKYPLDERTIADAQTVLRKMGIVAKSSKRARRPTLDELDRLLTHFGVVEKRRPDAIPMQKIIIFAIFSTRRQDEISRIARRDLEPGRVMVRDMKHPGEKIGNDTWCDLVPEAEAVIQSMPIADQRIFPASAGAISAAFTRACFFLEINTKDMPKAERLHFHDLRHEGISRLFEMGRTIPQAAMVSGHRSWESLKRYSHLRQTGDKYANWKWLELIKGQS